jgi:hypothetical protein
MHDNRTRRGIGLLAGLLGAAVSGCGAGRGDLSGTVSFAGKPLAHGSVLVVGSDGIAKGSPIQSDGTFAVKDIPAGAVKIAVTSPQPEKIKVGMRKQGEAPPPKVDSTRWFRIPDKYGDFETSELRATIRRGTNKLDITLE